MTPHCTDICGCVDWAKPEEWTPHFSESFTDARTVLTYGTLDTISTEPVVLCTLGKCRKCGKQICVGGVAESIGSFDDFMTRIAENAARGEETLSAETDMAVIALLHEEDREAGMNWLYDRYLRESFELRERDFNVRIRHITGYSLKLKKFVSTGLYDPYLQLLRILSLSDVEWLREQYYRRAQTEKELAHQIAEYSGIWDKAAVSTRLFSEAIEIAEAQRPSHTGNTWVCSAEGTTEIQEISNTVYKMKIVITPPADTAEAQAWDVRWAVTANMLPSLATFHYIYGKNSGETVHAGRKKNIPSEAGAREYAEGRKKAYAEFFTEEYPPVPETLSYFFSINGVLLPEYTLEDKL